MEGPLRSCKGVTVRTPLQTRSSASAEAMLAATLELLGEGGLSAVTVAAVAQRAGTSNGALYHRFGDRAGLLRAAQDRALGRIETAAAGAFAEADAEPDDAAALRQLATAALRIFAEHRPAMRAFLVEGQGDADLEARTEQSAHRLAETVVEWLQARLGSTRPAAEAAWRILFALGSAQALFEDTQVSPGRVSREELAEALARAVEAVVRH
jgi:AcrR family transcriptional regulator